MFGLHIIHNIVSLRKYFRNGNNCGHHLLMMDRVRINNSLIVWSLCIRKSNIAFNSVMCIFPPFTLVFSGSGAANSFAAKQPWHQKSGPDGALKESIQPVICGEATALANRRGLPRGSF